MIRKITLLFSLGILVAAVGYSQTPTPGAAPTTQSPNAPQSPDANRPPAPNPSAPQAQEQTPAPGQSSPPTSSPAASDKIFEGKLAKIDAATKTITVATLNPQEGDTKEMSFKYNDQTVVIGGDKTVQGLTGSTGSTLKITFQTDRDRNNMASRIEINDKQ